jgi:hypothetical protein
MQLGTKKIDREVGMVRRSILVAMVMIMAALFAGTPALAQGIIIDHTCTDITKIPDTWITQVKSQINFHYAHRSHGSQITTGLERLAAANAKYAYYPDNCIMPATTSYLSMMLGQYYDSTCETYVYPEQYWQGTAGLNITRGVLNTFNVNNTMWSWCAELDYYSQTEAQAYLDAMAQLESEYPSVTFIYMTGNAQSAENNRYQRNNQIRDYCRNNNKVLFDFADLDCWYNGEQYTEGGIPMEHPHYHGDEAGHTTYESCENKARAFWWLLARIAGWDGTTPVTDRERYDFNGDGHIDVLYRHPGTGGLGVWFMNGTTESSWSLIRTSTGTPANHGTSWDIGGVGDFNSDGRNDIIYRHPSGNIGVWTMNDTTESTWYYINNHGSWDIRGVADFNGDGKDDILYRHPGNGNIGLWYMNGTAETSWTLVKNPSGAAANHGLQWDIGGVGDFNNDGQNDILYRHSSGNIGVWYMNGASETTWHLIGNHGPSWYVKGVADYNNDGHVDILYRNSGNGNVGVWLMNGTTETSWSYINNHGSWDIR